MNNRERLIEILNDCQIERREVAAMLKVKIDTVNHWLAPYESRNHEDIPDMAIELLEIKLGRTK